MHLNEDNILDLIDTQPDGKLTWREVDSWKQSEVGGFRTEVECMIRFGLLGCDDMFIWTVRGQHGPTHANRMGAAGRRSHDYRAAAEVGPRDTFERMARNAELEALDIED